MQVTQSPTKTHEYIRALELKVRYAKEPNNPGLITHWLTLARCADTTYLSLREHYEHQFRLLLDTLADELLPAHWRRCCLDNINRPLLAMQRLSASSEHRMYMHRLNYELNVTCHYAAQSMTF